ncbi:MAG: DUF445 family protein [Defluviitaleaceae bacterium]|nr:DUF445 family protein [Defluviitaleaceae bacterium]
MEITLLMTPIIGAIIGYCTNVLAVRMLFRPHRAMYIFGVRIPFTPGLIPKGQARLAAKLANVVGTHILTPELLTDKLVNSPLISQGAVEIKKAIRTNIPKISEYLRNLEYPRLDEEGPTLVKNLINEHVGKLAGMFLDPKKIYFSMKDGLLEYLSDEDNLLTIADKIDENIDKFCEDTEKKIPLISAFETVAEHVVQHIDIKAIIEDRVNAFAPEEAEKLVLSVIRRELHLIMALGGILGFVIGLAPVVMSIF